LYRDINPSAKAIDSLEDIAVLLLVGGMGTRLRSVLSDKPKPLARVGDIPFLELLLLQLRSQGFRHLVMCTGFCAVQIQQEFSDGRKWGVEITYSEETRPLGTAGAIKLAKPFLTESCDFVVMNGDSFLQLDFRELLRFHKENDGCATIAVRRVPDAARYGTVQLDERNRVVRFSEKIGIAESGLVNGGVYMFNRGVLEHIPDGPASLEKDILPNLLQYGVFALEKNGMFIDIGTPEDYARAQDQYHSLSDAALLNSTAGPQKEQ
jgi:NDP-sugar pyrophosphorylase family protein